jgi:nitrate/TMAO reductase-like tetraheme cytochrome c subunit
MSKRLPKSYYNPLSYAGTAIALIALFMFFFLYVLSSFSSVEQAYVGIVLFLVIPFFIILGLVLIPIGMWRRARWMKKTGEMPKRDYPVLDLNQPRQRNATIIFTAGTLVFLFLSAFGSYEAYHFTESVEFCGKLCHEIMEPEYTAYHTSPHARVTCAQCHVGEGASWFVKSKLSGVAQVWHTLRNDYPRPIPTPVENLRPARETCETCHWPQKVYGQQQRREIHFLADETNTQWEIRLLLHTGTGNPALGQAHGIHWHINQNIRIEYQPANEKRTEIGKVVLINESTGDETVYNNPNVEENDSPMRVMDCIDCHNRPSHIYRSPSTFIDRAIVAGEIDSTLPYIKMTAVQACVQEYESDEQAIEGIASYITEFYADMEVSQAKVEKSIQGTIAAFQRNIFPYMNVTWQAYPNHIDHMTTDGCFRCHNDLHQSDEGKTISKTCTQCHDITAQGPIDSLEFSQTAASLEFKHPVDIGMGWQEINCSECHSVPPY